LGYGVNIRSGACIFQSSGGVYKKLALVRSPSTVIMLADVQSGIQWEKYYYNEPGHNATGSNTSGMVAYRHGNNTVVTFVDGHSEAFKNSKPNETITGKNTGLHAASLSGEVSARSDGR
jgi:prepilin-type processing-associated H-X9-DG protein